MKNQKRKRRLLGKQGKLLTKLLKTPRKRRRGGPQQLAAKPTRYKTVAQPNTQKILADLPSKSFEQLRGIWKNCVAKLANNESDWHQAASEILTAIEVEWQRRSQMAHPDEWFAWPTTDATGGNGKLVLKPSVSDGMLSYLDYRVGANGEVGPMRQGILARVFEAPLPPVFPADYMASWGAPKSAARLRKLVESIAAFTRNAKRRRDFTLDDAIGDWESDLSFLHEHYYLGRFSFAWPLTRI
jgi:hypothetical protein